MEDRIPKMYSPTPDDYNWAMAVAVQVSGTSHLDDIKQEACLALLQCAQRFTGGNFRTYAYMRVCGAALSYCIWSNGGTRHTRPRYESLSPALIDKLPQTNDAMFRMEMREVRDVASRHFDNGFLDFFNAFCDGTPALKLAARFNIAFQTMQKRREVCRDILKKVMGEA